MKQDVIIIGGGAAGLTAALSASKLGAKATVLEAAPRVGRKILASGNGRCNLANMRRQAYFGGGDAVPWSEYLPSFFTDMKGYDIREHLPKLFFNIGDDYRKIRYDYYEAATALF